jgi:uncharacterized protein YndB with AHSA1/START domain
MRMSVQIEGIVIERPIEDVFAFFSDFENSPLWGRTITTVKNADGPVGVGTVFREESKIMGRVLKDQSDVTVFDPPTGISYTSHFENGMSEQARFTFETVDGGTRMNPTADVEVARAPQAFAPIFRWQMKRQVRSLLKNLKDVLEAPGRPVA